MSDIDSKVNSILYSAVCGDSMSLRDSRQMLNSNMLYEIVKSTE